MTKDIKIGAIKILSELLNNELLIIPKIRTKKFI